MARRKNVAEAYAEVEKYESIAQNTMGRYGRISTELDEKLSWAYIHLAIAKDDASDPYMKD